MEDRLTTTLVSPCIVADLGSILVPQLAAALYFSLFLSMCNLPTQSYHLNATFRNVILRVLDFKFFVSVVPDLVKRHAKPNANQNA